MKFVALFVVCDVLCTWAEVMSDTKEGSFCIASRRSWRSSEAVNESKAASRDGSELIAGGISLKGVSTLMDVYGLC